MRTGDHAKFTSQVRWLSARTILLECYCECDLRRGAGQVQFVLPAFAPEHAFLYEIACLAVYPHSGTQSLGAEISTCPCHSDPGPKMLVQEAYEALLRQKFPTLPGHWVPEIAKQASMAKASSAGSSGCMVDNCNTRVSLHFRTLTLAALGRHTSFMH